MLKLTTILLLLLMAYPYASLLASEQKRIAITIDDVPFSASTPITIEETRELNSKILETLKQYKVEAVGFVNEDRLLITGQIDAGVAILGDWLDAGMELGNHNFGHVGLWEASLSEYKDAVVKGEVFTRWISEQKGSEFRYYRHPYTQTGKTEEERMELEAFLASHGYTVAPFTIEHDDYLFACVYDKLMETGQEALKATVAMEYDAHLRDAVASFESMSKELFGRQIAQIFLIHASRLNAATLDRTLSSLSEMGYQFVSLEEAMEDDAYTTPAHASGRFGPSWLARWARAKGKKLSVYGQPDPSGQTAKLYQELCSN